MLLAIRVPFQGVVVQSELQAKAFKIIVRNAQLRNLPIWGNLQVKVKARHPELHFWVTYGRRPLQDLPCSHKLLE